MMRSSSVLLFVVLFAVHCQASGRRQQTCKRKNRDCPTESEPFKRGQNFDLELQDSNDTTCIYVKRENKVKLIVKRNYQALIEVHHSVDGKENFNCTITNAHCSPFEETWKSETTVIRSAHCGRAKPKPKQIILECERKGMKQKKLKLCEIKVFPWCEGFWWDANMRCFQECRCSDGEKCGLWNGTCPSGKEPTAATALATSPTPAPATTQLSAATSGALPPRPTATLASSTSPSSVTDARLKAGSSVTPGTSTVTQRVTERKTLASTGEPQPSTASPTQTTTARLDLPSTSARQEGTAVSVAHTTVVEGLTTPTEQEEETTHSVVYTSSVSEGDDALTDSPHLAGATTHSPGTTAAPPVPSTSAPSTPPPLPPSTSTPLSSAETAATTPTKPSTDAPISSPDTETSPETQPSTAVPPGPKTPGPSTQSFTSPATSQGLPSPRPTTSSAEGSAGGEGPARAAEDRATKLGKIAATDGDDDDGKGQTLPVILGLSAMALLAVLILAAVGLHRVVKKARGKSEELVALQDTGNADPENQATADAIGSKDQSSSAQDGQGPVSMYANVTEVEPFSPTTEPVLLFEFGAHINRMLAVGGFQKEFQELPKGIQDAVTAAEDVNGGEKKKNRFKDILPYDDSRVLLAKDKESDSDYINASYIDGFVESMAYIAAQGPLVDTVEDFWHMVWTDHCGRIVMLTNLCEGAKIKCEQYWPEPEGSSSTFGRYTITSTRVTQKAHFTHRVLNVTKTGEQADESETPREIHQFHFTAWPDHGVPCAVALVQFWSRVTSQASPLTGPLVVHCSAGIGRTGTFIALDMLTHQAETTGKLSVFPTVKRLRKQRVNMVQTVSQYKFLHEAVNEWLAGRDSLVKRVDLLDDSQWTKKEGESGGVSQLSDSAREKIRKEFETLNQLRPEVTEEQIKTAKLEENTQKNRSLQVLPVEQYRVRLWTIDEEESDYVNAVFLPSLTRPQGYIVTQLPLESTVADFWRMVLDWRVKVIVRFMDTPKEEGVPVFPPEGEQTQHGPVSVQTLSKLASSPGITLYSVQLKRTEDTETRAEEACSQRVSVYSVESPGALSLERTGGFVSLVNNLMPLVTTAAQPPVLLQCFDGAGLSCVLCALLMAAEAMEAEETASPFLLARLIHMARAQAFRTQEEYEFVFRCLLHYAQGISDSEEKGDTPESVDTSKPTEEGGPVYNNMDTCHTTDETASIYKNV